MIIEMPPSNQQPTNSTPSGQFDSSQFDFIMNSGQNQKKGLIPLPSDPKQKLLVLIVGGAVGLVLLLALFFSIFGGSSGPVEDLVSVAQQQTEILRISDEASRELNSTDAQKLSTLVLAVVSSDRTKTINYMKENGRKVDAKELALKQSADASQRLKNAQQNGQLNEVYSEIVLEYLQAYNSNLESIYPKLGENGKALIEQNATNVQLILKDNQVALQ